MAVSEEIKIHEARDNNQLEQHGSSWDKLIGKCPQSTPTQSFGWLDAYFRYKLPANARWICLFAYNKNNDLLAVYPLIILKRTGFFRVYFQLFKIPFDPYHTVRTDGLFLPGYEYLLNAFIGYLNREFRAYSIIKIQRIPDFSPSMRYFNHPERKLRYFKKQITFEDFISINGSYETYRETLNSKFRRELKRQERRLHEKTEVHYHLDERQRSNEVNLQYFKEIENSGWKAREGQTIMLRPGDSELFSSATQRFHKNGWMEWNFVEADDKTISGMLGVKINEVVYYWRIGYDENYSFYSPGQLLVNKLIDGNFNKPEIQEVNFMNQRKWLRVWKVQTRELFDLIILPGNIFLGLLGKILLKLEYFLGKKKFWRFR